ncbi:MAG: hypothetical protein JST75_01840 [Bacteroidetes bacterium]|nr:hypothetical protein [Bacteroidota bacterium]
MKRKIFYTLIFILCASQYATSKEFSATGKKEEIEKSAKVLVIKKQPCEQELASLFPLVNFFHQVS